jgi:8-oxo-dGTP pyrophosphatase MutT (NUDIX family)
MMAPGIFEAAVLIPYTSDGKFLLQNRADTVARWPGYWSVFGGGIEPGESPSDAVVRELREELGYAVREAKYVFMQPIENGGKHIFIEQWDGSEVYQLDPKESVGSGWFTLAEARTIKIIPHDLEVLEKVSKILQK